MTPSPGWFALATVLAILLGLAIGWALHERRRRKAVERQRNNAVAEAARLRDQLRRQRTRGDATADLTAFRAEQRIGLMVQQPPSLLRITDPT